MNKLITRVAIAAAFLLSLAVCAQQGSPTRTSIIDVQSATVSIRLLDFSAIPIPNTAVEIYSDNGIVCRKAPCPTNSKQWSGRTDGNGFVTVPTNMLQAATSITTTAYGGDLVKDARRESGGTWSIRLERRD
jgi:hypothetical protein